MLINIINIFIMRCNPDLRMNTHTGDCFVHIPVHNSLLQILMCLIHPGMDGVDRRGK